MKTRLNRKAKQLASSLLTALVITSILSIFVMYYLSLIEQQHALSARSQTWNMAIAISEAGVEDGLEQVNTAYPDMATDGWTYDGSTCFSRSNSLPDGNGYMSYIFITNGINLTVVARAYVSPPSATYWQTTAMILFASQGQTVNTGPMIINRAVQVHCTKKTPWTAAMVAKKNINLNGNNIATDSFNSSDPSESTGGQYDPSKYRGSKGDVATNLGVIDSLGAGNANIYGHAHTGPGSPNNAVQIGPNGYIGAYPQSGSGIQSGYWMPDSNFDFPTTTYPNTASYLTPTNGWVTNMVVTVGTNLTTIPGLVPPGPPLPTGIQTNTVSTTGLIMPPGAGSYTGSYASYKDKGNTYYSADLITGFTYISSYTTNSVPVGTYYDHILWGTSGTPGDTNYYVASDLSGKTVVEGPNVVLALPNGLNMSGGDSFTIAPGGNVTAYSGGSSANIAIGGNSFINQPGYAGDFILLCAPSVTSFSLSGNGTFIGVVVAPNADVTLNGGGNNTTDFVGSLMVNSVTMNGHFNFHYDEALSGNPAWGRFLITSWNEVK